MKVYKKMKRAVAQELGDQRFLLNFKYYDWYEEDDFPHNMRKIVDDDNPFGGWFEYYEEEKFVPVGELAGDVLVRKNES